MAMPGFALEPIAKMGRLGSPRPPTSPQQLPSRLDFLDQMKDDDSHSLLESELSFREESEANPLSSRLPFRNPFPGEDIEDSDSDEERGEPSKADHPDSAADRTVSENGQLPAEEEAGELPAEGEMNGHEEEGGEGLLSQAGSLHSSPSFPPSLSQTESVRLGRHMRAHPGRERLEKAPTVEEQEQGRKLRQQLQDQQKYHRQQADMRQFVQHSINRELMRRDLSLQERSRAQHQQMKQLLNDAFQFPAMVEQVLQGHSQAALPPTPHTTSPPTPISPPLPTSPPPEMALVLSESNLRGAETLEGEHDEDVRTVMENLVQSEIQRLKSV